MSKIVGDGSTFTCKHLMRGPKDCVFCERDQLRAQLYAIRNESLSWAMACPCECAECNRLYDVIREVK